MAFLSLSFLLYLHYMVLSLFLFPSPLLPISSLFFNLINCDIYSSFFLIRQRSSFFNQWSARMSSSLSSALWKQECSEVWPIRAKLFYCRPINAKLHCTDMYLCCYVERPNPTSRIKKNAIRTCNLVLLKDATAMTFWKIGSFLSIASGNSCEKNFPYIYIILQLKLLT